MIQSRIFGIHNLQMPICFLSQWISDQIFEFVLGHRMESAIIDVSNEMSVFEYCTVFFLLHAMLRSSLALLFYSYLSKNGKTKLIGNVLTSIKMCCSQVLIPAHIFRQRLNMMATDFWGHEETQPPLAYILGSFVAELSSLQRCL